MRKRGGLPVSAVAGAAVIIGLASLRPAAADSMYDCGGVGVMAGIDGLTLSDRNRLHLHL